MNGESRQAHLKVNHSLASGWEEDKKKSVYLDGVDV